MNQKHEVKARRSYKTETSVALRVKEILRKIDGKGRTGILTLVVGVI